MLDRAKIVHENFLERVKSGDLPEVSSLSLEAAGLSTGELRQIIESQFLSRQLDRCSRALKDRGESFYTIGSSGHEGNAAIAAAFRKDDMAFLHYRDAGFFIQRAKVYNASLSSPLPSGERARVRGQEANSEPESVTPTLTLPPQGGGNERIDITQDMLLSFAASKDDPISGGRHKVLGSKPLFVPPQTSTIASHLPKALGAASSIGINRRLKLEGELPKDSVILCSFGDASLNHSTAQGAINTSSWMAYQKIHLPLVWVCEDNGIGISVPTPDGWVAATMSQKPGLKYFSCNGLDVLDSYRTAREVEAYTRKNRLPAFLHFRCIRLFGHAGADAQHVYMDQSAIEATEAHDPLLYSARLLMEHCEMGNQQVIDLYEAIGEEVAIKAEAAIQRAKLETAEEVMASIIPPATSPLPSGERSGACPVLVTGVRGKAANSELESATPTPTLPPQGGRSKNRAKPQNMARLINLTLQEAMANDPSICLMGEDVGKKGGVYSVTAGLHRTFGPGRIIDTLLDEQSILGLAIGMAHNGLLPVPEIQFLAYLHNAEDQLRGEAATLPFFSQGQYTNPMVVRIAGLAYQRGFGGHFHNDNSLAVLRDIPGLILACPSRGEEAVSMLKECFRLAKEEQRLVVFLEPIALYMTRDLHAPKDDGWSSSYEQALNHHTPFGECGVIGKGKDLAIITYGNGTYLSSQAQKVLSEEHQINCRIIDLRWLTPLPFDALLEAIKGCKHLLIVDECRKSGNVSEELMTRLQESLSPLPPMARITAEDSFIPLGKAATATLPSKESIIDAARALVK
jgi:2-oxoisovalerate dehydrogenase E1 component